MVVEIYQRKGQKMIFILSYRHPNQPPEEVESYFSSLNRIIEISASEKPLAVVVTGDFNSRSSFFWDNDADTMEGRVLSELTVLNNLEQLVSEPTHIRDDGSKSCIDLVFTDQPYIFTNVEVIPHSERQSKHQIVHGKMNFNIPCPPRTSRKVFDYDKANIDLINLELAAINWPFLFSSKNVNEMCDVFHENFLDIISKNIPNPMIENNEVNALWVTDKVKTA